MEFQITRLKDGPDWYFDGGEWSGVWFEPVRGYPRKDCEWTIHAGTGAFGELEVEVNWVSYGELEGFGTADRPYRWKTWRGDQYLFKSYKEGLEFVRKGFDSIVEPPPDNEELGRIRGEVHARRIQKHKDRRARIFKNQEKRPPFIEIWYPNSDLRRGVDKQGKEWSGWGPRPGRSHAPGLEGETPDPCDLCAEPAYFPWIITDGQENVLRRVDNNHMIAKGEFVDGEYVDHDDWADDRPAPRTWLRGLDP